MATNSVWVDGLLDEAAAIVEAEWIRLQDEALWEDEVADLFTDLPAPRAGPASHPGHRHHCAAVVMPFDA